MDAIGRSSFIEELNKRNRRRSIRFGSFTVIREFDPWFQKEYFTIFRTKDGWVIRDSRTE